MKRIILLAIIAGGLFFTGCHEFTNPVDPYFGLIAHFPFDGDAKNKASLFADGVMSDGVEATADRNGNPAGALKFDGVDDYIKVNDSEDLRIKDKLTLSAWVKLDEVDWDYARIVVKEWGTGVPYVSYGLMADHNASGKFGFHLSDIFDEIIYIQADDLHSTDVWYHVAGVWDGSIMLLYVNGQQQQETASTDWRIGYPDFIGSPDAALNMGGDTARDIEFLNGSIDDVRVYNRALSALEISALYNGTDTITAPNAEPDPDKAYKIGGSGHDYLWSIELTLDGGTVMAGWTDSFGAGGTDAWLMKYDSQGELEWQKCYGEAGDDKWFSVDQGSDGSLFLGGLTTSFGAGYNDYWLAKTDTEGNILWEKAIGTSFSEQVYSIIATSDGGCILTGDNLWVIKLDSAGNIQWHKSYDSGYGGTHRGSVIRQLSEGGYIAACLIPDEYLNIWITKLSAGGDVDWTRSYGGADDDRPGCMEIIADGGMIMGGFTESYGAGGSDIWLMRLSAEGNIEWQKAFGTASNERIGDVISTSDGGFLFSGYSDGLDSYRSLWCVKIDSSGSIQWQKSYDNQYYSIAYSIVEPTVQKYILGGVVMKENGGNYDAIRMGLNSVGECGSLLTTTTITPADTTSSYKSITAAVANESIAVINTSATVINSTATVIEITE